MKECRWAVRKSRDGNAEKDNDDGVVLVCSGRSFLPDPLEVPVTRRVASLVQALGTGPRSSRWSRSGAENRFAFGRGCLRCWATCRYLGMR